MSEKINQSIDFAYNDNIAAMHSSIEDAIKEKLISAIENKKIEIAQSFMQKTNESSEPFDDFEDDELEEGKKPSRELKGNQFKIDKNKNGKLDSNDFKLLRKESYIEEKLSVSDGIKTWIDDFIQSDNPRFEGKSKEERRKMAIAAFYSAQK